MKAILGKKLGMTQIYLEDQAVPVTVIQAGPCKVLQRRNLEKHGYDALQLGYETTAEERINKPMAGQFKKAESSPYKYLMEIPAGASEAKAGDELSVEQFAAGEKATVTGISKGKGFAGVMKRWNFKGQGASHGAHRVHRARGSIGSSATPSRVLPGRKMAGRMGGDRVTVKNLQIAQIDIEKNLLMIRGAVPGAVGGLVIITGKS